MSSFSHLLEVSVVGGRSFPRCPRSPTGKNGLLSFFVVEKRRRSTL